MGTLRPRGFALGNDSANRIWQAALGQLELEIPRPNFETWLKGTSAQSLDGDTLVVTTPSAFAAEALEQRLSAIISRVVERVASRSLSVEFAVAGEALTATQPEARASRPQSRPDGNALRPGLTFDTFIVGDSNKLAHAAAAKVAESPGQAYNPLYIYSQVGLGKTHLLHAIAHSLVEKGLEILYVSSERFTNDYIKAIRAGTADQFRERYRSTDALLIDDIQFIASKEQTQEGFFHTFNELHMSGRQVVVTGDEPARKSLLEERIVSRLEGGLVVDIQPPDLETRIAILESKAYVLKVDVPVMVLELLARRSLTNVRELEGSLNRVVAYSQLVDSPIDPELATRALSNLIDSDSSRSTEPQDVIQEVSERTGVDIETILGRRRDKRTTHARHMAMYLLREESHLPSTRVGEIMGGKDHSSVLYGQRRFAEQLDDDPSLRHLIAAMRISLSTESNA